MTPRTIAAMNVTALITACQQVYQKAQIVAGPDGRDGASVYRLPSGETILAFRGTITSPPLASALDWENDLRAELVTADGFPGRVHKGFLASLNNLWHEVFAELSSGDNPFQMRLFITGHSKGGALAQLAGVRLAALKPSALTFAAPRAGNRLFAAGYPSAVPLFRCEGAKDLVPLLPPEWDGYVSAGAAIYQDAGHAYLRPVAIGELIVEGKWNEVAAAHHLSTYAEWTKDVPDPLLTAA